MNHLASCLSGSKLLQEILLTCALTAAIVGSPPLAGAQAPAQPAPPPPGTSTQAPPSGPSQPTPPNDTPAQTGSQAADAAYAYRAARTAGGPKRATAERAGRRSVRRFGPADAEEASG